MDYNYLAELLFPDVRETPEDMEKRYPPRELPEGAKVTRFAPSPTGFVHFGGLFPSTVGDRLALFIARYVPPALLRSDGADESLHRLLLPERQTPGAGTLCCAPRR